ELVADCEHTMHVVARFLGLLELYREAAVVFDQEEPLGTLLVQLSGAGLPAVDALGEDYR
ncbi:MAG: segregation/condensation protein A, partial [Mycobacteriaceae bacterium]